jgi:predicted nucleic acid-binding protein
MAGGSPLYYWDTCLFLAWLKDERRKPGEMDGLREVVSRLKRREIRLVTSVITQVEVLQSKMPVGVGSSFTDLLKRLSRISVDIKIAALAHDLRNHYASAAFAGGAKTLSVPDSIHLATAIMYRVDEFHTFDLGLTSLSGDIGGHKLVICIPRPISPQLDLRRTV